jgi:hypothetical protein
MVFWVAIPWIPEGEGDTLLRNVTMYKRPYHEARNDHINFTALRGL